MKEVVYAGDAVSGFLRLRVVIYPDSDEVEPSGAYLFGHPNQRHRSEQQTLDEANRRGPRS
jgi:hypothetical protein